MCAEVPRLFVFARHAESTANTAHLLSSNPARPVALTERGRAQARLLGAQLANVHIDLAVGTRFLRTRETIDTALYGRHAPVLIEPASTNSRPVTSTARRWRPTGPGSISTPWATVWRVALARRGYRQRSSVSVR
jgi:phosphohistidine phosphatase SixA